jgi:hypothetical protein
VRVELEQTRAQARDWLDRQSSCPPGRVGARQRGPTTSITTA